MSTHPVADHHAPLARLTLRQLAVGRAVLALLWALALVLAVGDDVPRTSSDVPVAAAALLAAYPLIDVVASLPTAAGTGAAARLARLTAAVGLLAVLAVGLAAFGSDAGATLVAFGAWAAVSGALLLVTALRRRGEGGRLPLLVSGGLSTLAGLAFVAAGGREDAQLAGIAGYMALGAVLYLVWALRTREA